MGKTISKISFLLSLSILLAIFIFVFFIFEYDLLVRTDFISYFTGASLLLKGEGKSLFGVQAQSSFQGYFTNIHERLNPFKNPPTLALFFIPLSFFSIDYSYKIFVLVNILILIIAANKVATNFPTLDKNLIFFTLLLFFPTIISIITGQISLMLLILWFYLLKYSKNQKPLASGFLTALLFNKPQYLIFTPFVYLTSKKKKQFLIAFISTAALQIVLSLLLVGWEGFLKYPKFLIDTESSFYRSDIYSQMNINSFLHYANLLLGFSKNLVYLVNLFLYLIFLLIFAKKYRKISYESSFFAATFFTLALAPHAWEFDLTLILLPIIFLLDYTLKKRRKGTSRKLASIVLFSLYFCWTLRFVGYPFMISFVLLISGLTFLFNSELNLKQSFFRKKMVLKKVRLFC